MDALKIYAISLLVFAMATGVAVWWIAGITPENLKQREQLPRKVFAGMVLAAIDLLWCIPHTKPLLPEWLHVYLLPTAVVLAVVAFLYLDYLFSRAIGGFFILLAYYFLHESFTFHSPAAPFFSLFCFALGIVGIFFSGKPYLMRDAIRLAARSRYYKYMLAALTAGFGLFSLLLGILHLTGRAG
ncbi:MAG: hypothetical protein PHQ27_02075 [Victivallales bacterium]|nr:hypothetical protein [Victivallales bacterium]